MKIEKVIYAYFSATSTTKQYMNSVLLGIAIENLEKIDITQGLNSDIKLSENQLLVIAVPVYSGRVPQIAAQALKRIMGDNTPAIIMCVYGNRDYDDALLELSDIVTNNDFRIVSAAAFIAQHSIFPKVANGRPLAEDMNEATNFGRKNRDILDALPHPSLLSKVSVKGNHPYREVKPIPLKPKGNKDCNACGTCANLCPTQAIGPNNPRKTNKNLCISCARCIHVCPKNARHFGGILYAIASRKFGSAYASANREADIAYATIG